VGACAQPHEGAPGTALDALGFPSAPGCPGLVAELACQPLPADLPARVVVPFAVELAAAERVCIHSHLLSARGGNFGLYLVPPWSAARVITTRNGHRRPTGLRGALINPAYELLK
jgi:hypothetical protein